MFVIEGERLPIKVWAEPEDLDGFDDAIDQARNLANHPLAALWVCLMPDFHVGYGMPIGGVLATKGGVVPNAVGVDIGCGMIAARTDIQADAFDRDTLEAVRQATHRRVPVGNNWHKQAIDHPFAKESADLIQDVPIIREQLANASRQLGTLGSGNHFIELQREPATGRLWVMIHSGSRNIGKRTCDHFHGIAKTLMKENGIAVPHADLSFLPAASDDHDTYLRAMQWCMQFAEASRQRMLDSVCQAFAEVTRVEVADRIDLTFDTHHNFAAEEEHFGETVFVHRKGAVKAEGLVTIPGSMGTASYICEGLTPAASFNTCSHGAGRVLGRREANRRITHEQAVEMMKHVVFGVRSGDYDEMPTVYKDIDRVIAAQSDLVRSAHRLEPLAVVKG